MKREDLDRELTRWRAELDAMVSNIFELSELMAYQMLEGEGGRIEGDRAAEIVEAVESVDLLMAQASSIREVIDGATARRDLLPRLGQAKAIEEILALFDRPSILLEVSEVPLAQRSLLSRGGTVEARISPRALKQQMVERFERAKRVLLELESAAARVAPYFESLRARAEALSQRRLDYGAPSPAVDALRQRLCELEAQLTRNPYAVAGSPESLVVPYFRAVEVEIESLERAQRARLAAERTEREAQERAERQREAEEHAQRAACQDELKRMAAALELLLAERADCLAVFAECQARDLDPSRLASPPGTRALVTGLRQLEDAVAAGDWARAQEAAPLWFAMCAERLAETRAAHARNAAARVLVEDLADRWRDLERRIDIAREHGVLLRGGIKGLVERVRDLMSRRHALDDAQRALEILETRLDEELAAVHRGQ